MTVRLMAELSAPRALAELASSATHLAADIAYQIEAAMRVLAPIADAADMSAGVAFQILADALASARPPHVTN